MNTQRRKIELRSDHGQAMTEFAIVLPFLCLLFFGIIQFGILWNNYVTITDAARAGARKAAVSRHTNPATEGCNAARASAVKLNLVSKGTCSVSVAGPLDRPGADVTVTVTYPYSIDLLGFALADGSLEAKTTERME